MVRSAELLRCSCAQLYEAYLVTGGPEANIVHPAFEQESSGEPTLVNDGQGGQKTVDNPKAGKPKTWEELTVPEKTGARWLHSLEWSKTQWSVDHYGNASGPITMPPEEWSKKKWDDQAGPITMGTPLGPSLRPRLCAATRNLPVLLRRHHRNQKLDRQQDEVLRYDQLAGRKVLPPGPGHGLRG